MDRKPDRGNLSNELQSQFQFSALRHPACASSGENDKTPNLHASQHPPHHSSDANKFDRLGTDWLRRRAITGVMRSTAAGFTSEAPSVHSLDHPTQRGPAPNNEDIQTVSTPPQARNTFLGESTQALLGVPGFYSRHDNGAGSHLQHVQGPKRQTLEQSSNIGPDRGSPSPNDRHHHTANGSPPAGLLDPASWLLPRPFRHEFQLPLVGETPCNESEELGASAYIASTRSFDGEQWSSSADTPEYIRKEEHNNRVIRSPHFRQGNAMPESSGARIRSPSDRAMGSSPPPHPFQTTSATVSTHQSDPSTAVESSRSSSQYWATRQSQHRRHHYHHRADSHGHNVVGHSQAHRRETHDPATGSPVYNPPAKVDIPLASAEARESPGMESEYGYGPSVISRAVTQTLTPNPSPYERLMTHASVRKSLSKASGTCRDVPTAERLELGERWSQITPPPAFHAPVNSLSRLRSPFQPRQQDSSIISPLGHLTAPQYPLRHAQNLTELPRDDRQKKAQAEGGSVPDYVLSSDSESDTEDMSARGRLHTTQRADVNQAPHSRTASEPTQEQDFVICAVSESRSSEMIGVAVINVTIGTVDLVRIVNDDRYRRLSETLWRMPTQPQTFLVLKKIIHQQSKSTLVICLEKEFPGAEVVLLDREHWNESEGLKMVDRFAWRQDTKAICRSLEHNFYVSCAFSAVMAYIEEETEVIFRENSLRIKYKQPADTMGLDRSTITFLELFQNIRNVNGTSSTLFALLNNTLTPQGRRMIRSALLQPSTKKDEITARHAAVDELSSNEDLFTELRASLKRLLHIDIGRSIPWVTLTAAEPRLPLQDGIALIQGRHQIAIPSHEELQGAEKDLNHVLMIKAYLGGVQAVRETLEAAECTSELCKWVLEKCGPEAIALVAGLLEEAIEPDAIFSKTPIDTRNNRLWAVKSEPNGVLEGARQLYRDRTNEMHQYVEELNKTFQEQLGTAPELRLANDNHYYLRFQWSDVERELPKNRAATDSELTAGAHHWRPRLLGGVEIVNGIRRKQHYDCQTLELIQRSSQIQRHADIVTTQSDRFVVDLKKRLLEHAESLLAVNEAIAVLDMLCSFAHLATTQNYVRPILSNNLVLKGARHPVMEIRRQNFVANDVYSGDHGARFQVVTGGNMSGKSTFIRTIALIQIMAQVGSFVPATYAALPICDCLFTRLSTEDKPQSNLGTFAVEMTEMNMILRQVTRNSLVIIDELGRGTSTTEGLAIALAMSEKLIKKECRVFFATHFTELARVLNSTKQSSVLNVHIAGESTMDGEIVQISLPHTIAPGPVKNEDYGLELARRFLPERVVKNAKQVSKFLHDKSSNKATGPATRAAKQNKLILALPGLLKQAHDSTMDDSALASYLKKLQTEFTIRMNIAADDDVREDRPGGNADHPTGLPVLEKPSEKELEEWKKKCEASERRVMHANMAHSQEKKRLVPASESGEYMQKRTKTENDTQSIASQFTPINRGLMIDELRKGACTPTTRAETPSSFKTDPSESQADYPVEEAMNCEDGPIEIHSLIDRQRAVSISSGSSNWDTEMPDIDDLEDFLPATSARPGTEIYFETIQPLERFQPLKDWYARGDQAAGLSSGESDGASTPSSLRRSHSGRGSFLRGIDEDEKERESDQDGMKVV